MAKRANPRGSQLIRGFLLGMLYERGFVLCTERIRREFGASRATAKRDMAWIRGLVPTLSSKALRGQKNHVAQRTLGRKEPAAGAALPAASNGTSDIRSGIIP